MNKTLEIFYEPTKTSRLFALVVFAAVLLLVPSPPFVSSSGPSRTAHGKVFLFCVDGLRPDVVEALALKGKLPNIRALFFNQGVRFKNCFTVFPSNTIIANGVLTTGKWPENSGLKTQAFFERFRTAQSGALTHWMKRIGKRTHFPRWFNLLSETDVAPRILKNNKIRAVYDYLGERYHASVVPVNFQAAPAAWPHVAANTVKHPYRVTAEAEDAMDEINGNYALEYMVKDRKADVYLVWFPKLDTEQHRHEDGQFGEVGDLLIDIDSVIGKVRDSLTRSEKEKPVYFILFSDHGAYGGKNGLYNQPFHIARDFFYQELKMNVLGPDFSITHPGTDPRSFAFVDNMGRGQASCYLPVRDGLSADWSRPNSFYELTHYGLGPARNPVNLISALKDIDLTSRNAFPGRVPPNPVDVVIVKLSKEQIYIRGQKGSEALIQTKRFPDQETLYRYLPVTRFSQDERGIFHFEETEAGDPLNYLSELKPEAGAAPIDFLRNYHTPAEWLRASYLSTYPDAVPAIAKLLNWHPDLAALGPARDPDFILSAAPGWNFRVENINGADHGSLRADSMRMTLMISGPHIKQGVAGEPHRLVELTPTIFELIGYEGKTDFDAEPIREIYEN